MALSAAASHLQLPQQAYFLHNTVQAGRYLNFQLVTSQLCMFVCFFLPFSSESFNLTNFNFSILFDWSRGHFCFNLFVMRQQIIKTNKDIFSCSRIINHVSRKTPLSSSSSSSLVSF